MVRRSLRRRSSSKKRSVVIKEMVGRLGNQMFEYASALGIAHRKKGTVCIADKEWEEDSKEDLIKVCVGPFKRCNNIKGPITLVPEDAYAKYDPSPFLVSGNVEIETDLDQGFLQSWKYFQPVKKEVLKKFKFKRAIASRAERYIDKAKAGKTTVIGIHIRRGDHIGLGYMRFPPMSYFKKAQQYFRKKYKKVKFVIATNDRAWARENFKSKDTEIITSSKSAPEDMAILTMCSGLIMSLGTFSWWAGYLGKGQVVYYNREFVMSHAVNAGNVSKEDYYPPKWIGM